LGVFELAFPDHPFKSFAGIFDAILIVAAVARQESYDLVGAIADHVADGAGREVD